MQLNDRELCNSEYSFTCLQYYMRSVSSRRAHLLDFAILLIKQSGGTSGWLQFKRTYNKLCYRESCYQCGKGGVRTARQPCSTTWNRLSRHTLSKPQVFQSPSCQRMRQIAVLMIKLFDSAQSCSASTLQMPQHPCRHFQRLIYASWPW